MNIIPAGNGTYVINCEKSELEYHYISKEYALQLIQNALNLSYLPHSTSVYLYEGCDSVIIFAVLPPAYYSFDDFEDVISACKNCSISDSALYYYDGRYILSVPLPCSILSEFGIPVQHGRLYKLFLQEHGKTVIEEDAVNFVKNTF